MLMLFQLGYLYDHLFGKELFIRFTVMPFVNVCQFVCALLSVLDLRVVFDCINS